MKITTRQVVLAGFMQMNQCSVDGRCKNCELSADNFIDRLRVHGFKIVRRAAIRAGERNKI
jgi:hypothetical protein